MSILKLKQNVCEATFSESGAPATLLLTRQILSVKGTTDNLMRLPSKYYVCTIFEMRVKNINLNNEVLEVVSQTLFTIMSDLVIFNRKKEKRCDTAPPNGYLYILQWSIQKGLMFLMYKLLCKFLNTCRFQCLNYVC